MTTINHKKLGFGNMPKGEGYGDSGKKATAMWIHIDAIDVDFTRNVRIPPYCYPEDSDSPLAGKPCCFTDAQCEDLFETLPDEQEQDIVVYTNPATGRHEVVEGYRRAYAVHRLRDKGVEMRHGYALRCRKASAPKNGEQWSDAYIRSVAMQSMMPLTPMDISNAAERMIRPQAKGGGGMKEADARRKLAVLCLHSPHFRTKPGEEAISDAQFKKLLRLMALPPALKLAVYEGASWTAVLAKASRKGVGNVRGPSGPQKPRGFRPSQAVACADSEAFAGHVPETIGRDDLLAILAFMGDATRMIPKWARDAIEAQKDEVRVAKEAAGKKKAPPRDDKAAA